MIAVQAQVQFSREQSLDSEDACGSVLYELEALAREVVQCGLRGRKDAAFG